MNLKDLLKKASNYLEQSKIRRWIDEEDANKGLEDSYKASKVNDVEEFLAQVGRTIANLMKMKKFVIPNGKVYLPDKYIVFLSPQKDKEFQGRMRKLFIEGLQYLSEEAATGIIGKSSVNEIPIKVEIRVDGTLYETSSSYRVQIVDSETGNTEIFETKSTMEEEETIVQLSYDKTIIDDDTTIVEASSKKQQQQNFYHLVIFSNGEQIENIPITKKEIKIGRPAKTSQSDVELPNGKISRHHITVCIDESNSIWITHHGQNPTRVNGIKLNYEEKRLIRPEQKIEIENFVLIIKK